MALMELAFLLRVPLYELTAKMSFEEYYMWGLYFEAKPSGWREDERTYLLLRGLGMKSAPESLFASLALKKQQQEKQQAASKPVPRVGSFLHAKMMNAKGGKKLEFLKDL
jgi:hypothetical protein